MAERQQRKRMSRVHRSVRGTLISAVSSILAAASHALGGGGVSAEGVIATAIIGLPLCVALAGRAASVWRVGLAVSVSQFFYHWTFAGLDVVSQWSDDAADSAMDGHAAHLASLERFVPDVAVAASAGALMWIMHALAAVATTAFIVRGEQACLALLRAVRRALPHPVSPVVDPYTAIAPAHYVAPLLRRQQFLISECVRRGPPRYA